MFLHISRDKLKYDTKVNIQNIGMIKALTRFKNDVLPVTGSHFGGGRMDTFYEYLNAL